MVFPMKKILPKKIYFYLFFFCPQKVEKTTPKSCLLMAVGRLFFSAAPTVCPKQPRTSFPFYKFFYPTISGRISAYTWEQIFFYIVLRSFFFHFCFSCYNQISMLLCHFIWDHCGNDEKAVIFSVFLGLIGVP